MFQNFCTHNSLNLKVSCGCKSLLSNSFGKFLATFSLFSKLFSQIVHCVYSCTFSTISYLCLLFVTNVYCYFCFVFVFFCYC